MPIGTPPARQAKSISKHSTFGFVEGSGVTLHEQNSSRFSLIFIFTSALATFINSDGVATN